ncbi:putative mitochondrial protein [Tanacetum coccineum]
MTISLSAIEGGDDAGHEGELGVVRLERELDRDAADEIMSFGVERRRNERVRGEKCTKEASEDDDGVLDKPSLELRFKQRSLWIFPEIFLYVSVGSKKERKKRETRVLGDLEASEDDDGVLDKPSLELRSLVNPVSIRFMKLCFGSKRVSCACFLQVLVLYVQYGISKVRIRRIEESGVTTNPSKIEAIKNWPVPSTLKQFRGFLGLSRYYSGFIKSYAMLKKAMMEAPILRLPDFDQEFVIETYAYGIGAVLCQNGHPLAYLSKTLSTKHQALSTYEKDFMAVVGKSGKGWLPKLLGYDYEIVFKKGVDNAAVDAFSRVYQGAELLQIVVSSMASDVMEKIKASWQSDDTMQQLVSKGSQLQG